MGVGIVMRVPFSHDQFLTVFANYNTALWPVAIVLWVATLAGSVLLVRGRARGPGLAALLTFHWAWSGVAYHALHFTSINRAARVFAGLFVAQALAFAWTGMVHRRLVFAWGGGPRHALAGVLLVFALAYPGLALSTVADWPRAPLFGVPCPTTLFTAGCLLTAGPPVPRWLFVIPVLWSFVGGSAAWLLGVAPDLMLFVAGAALVAFAVAPHALDRRPA
jgi:hypothetical protein